MSRNSKKHRPKSTPRRDKLTLFNSLRTPDRSPEIFVAAAQTGDRICFDPKSALEDFQKLDREIPEVLKQVRNMQRDGVIIAALGHLGWK